MYRQDPIYGTKFMCSCHSKIHQLSSFSILLGLNSIPSLIVCLLYYHWWICCSNVRLFSNLHHYCLLNDNKCPYWALSPSVSCPNMYSYVPAVTKQLSVNSPPHFNYQYLVIIHTLARATVARSRWNTVIAAIPTERGVIFGITSAGDLGPTIMVGASQIIYQYQYPPKAAK